MKNNTYFENLEKFAHAYGKKLHDHETLKQGIVDAYGWDSDELKAWYAEKKAIEETNPYGMGAHRAYRAWKDSESDELEFSDFCWEKDIPEFISTLRQAGIKTFVVTNQSTALMENIHGFIREGCTLEGACILTRKSHRWGIEEEEQVQGLRFAL